MRRQDRVAKTVSQDFWASPRNELAPDADIERIDFRMWEDELIFHELEEGLRPWTFETNEDRLS